MLLSMALGQNWTDILVGGMLHPPPGMKRSNSECQICMIYCLQLWRHVSAMVCILNVLESCGFGWLTEEHPGSPSVPLFWGVYHRKTRTGVPSGPTAPSSTVWLKDVRPCCLGAQIISFVSVCDTLPGNWESHGFSCILHFTFNRYWQQQ
jgi:hypothetical protein